MTSSTGKLCGPCEARYKTTTAISWCMDCDDGLCSSCLEDHKVNKASKKHQNISASQYVRIESVSSLIKQECDEHDQRLAFYCLDHYVTACALCIPEKHKQCTSLKPIEELARNAKSSAELFDIERGIKELESTVDELTNNRQRNIDEIKDQEKHISTEIESFRNLINKHLDILESDLLKELECKSNHHITEINLLLEKLKEKGAKLKSVEKTIHQLKETLSNIQVFLATKSIGVMLHEDQELVSTLCNKNEAKELVLELSTDPQLKHLLSNLKSFGTIQVICNPCSIKVGVCDQQKAQTHVPIPTVRDIDQVELQFITDMTYNASGFGDCVIVDDGRMIYAHTRHSELLVCERDGRLSQNVSVGQHPFGLAVITHNTVAVTCCESKTIEIVNIDQGVVTQTINGGPDCSGISYHKGKLYTVVAKKGIMELDLYGNYIRTIRVDVPSKQCYLSCYEDKFCYTCYNSRFIACCDINGEEIWRLDVADAGVTVDNYGNYIAAKRFTGELQIISADGKRTKQLQRLGIGNPGNGLEGVFFYKNSSTLLVTYLNGGSKYFRVKHFNI